MKSESGAKSARSQEHCRKAEAHVVVGDGMSGSVHGITKETCAGGSGAGVRVPVVAMKRLITAEPRGAGRWKRE